MMICLAKLLYYVGDLVGWFLRFNCFGWLYPLYSEIMLLSSRLDKDGKIWKIVNKRKLHDK